MSEVVNKTVLTELAEALAECEDKDLINDFLHCLLTENETKEISSRWVLVRMLKQGVSQRKIASALGLSLCKITRGSKELKKPNSPFGRMIEIYQEKQKYVETK